MNGEKRLRTFAMAVCCVAFAMTVRGEMPVLTPADGKDVVEVHDLVDDLIAFTNYSRTAEIVAFDRLPRANVLHSWKGLGVTVLKTVRFEREGTAEHFRREVGFLAFQSGADGIWIPNAKDMPENWREALRRGRKDRELIDYLDSLRAQAEKSPDGLIRIEANRVTFFFAWMSADWENLDCLRLEVVAWAKRMEQLLGLPAKDLPTDYEPEIEPAGVAFKPYDELPSEPPKVALTDMCCSLDLGGGLSFLANNAWFTLTWTTTNGPALKDGTMPGGSVDFHLCIPGKAPGDWLPYRFHVDLDPDWTAPRAPGTGRINRASRFRPFAIAYGAINSRVLTWPQLRTFGPECPDPRPAVGWGGNRKDNRVLGGYYVSLTVNWPSFYGFWPGQTDNRQDVWYVGVDRTPESSAPIARRIVWPRGASKLNFMRYARLIGTRGITIDYQRELDRTLGVWSLGWRERYYTFPKTERPTFYRGDRESDAMFCDRILQPLFDRNENMRDAIWDDDRHRPTFGNLPAQVREDILRNLPRLIHLSYEVGRLRRDYLRDRFAGKEPPVPSPKKAKDESETPKAPDADFNEDAIQLDDKEF